jgi:hypothetical protein
MKVVNARGFGDKWNEWIRNILEIISNAKKKKFKARKSFIFIFYLISWLAYYLKY